MKIALVRIKGLNGDLSLEMKPFNTDTLNLRKGDMVLVFDRKGLELGVFEEYADKPLATTGFVTDKVSGERIERRLKEQRDMLKLS